MRKLIYVLMCICFMAVTVSAEIIGFEAENSGYSVQVGTKWDTLEDEGALGGKYITPNENLPADTPESRSIYTFNIPAGTYNVYVKARIGTGTANDDSFYLSNDSFAETAGLTDYNGMDDLDIDGNSIVLPDGNFGWVIAHQSYDSGTLRTYVQAEDGLAFFIIRPREDGLELDAFAFVPEGDEVTTQMLDDSVGTPGTPTDPEPSNGNTTVDSESVSSISWVAPEHDDIASIQGYDVYFGIIADPNVHQNPMTQTSANTLPVTLTFDTTYYWRVDTRLTWSDTTEETVEGTVWKFTTLPDDKTPVIIVSDVLTSLEYMETDLAGTINDYGEGDIASVTWELLDAAGADSKQMIVRTDHVANLEGLTDDPNMLMDWIGIDIRDNKLLGNPMVLTLRGLPAGTYSWKSYHHDAESQTGIFDVKVEDSAGSQYFYDIDISNGTDSVTTLDATIEADGTNDVKLYFHQQFANSDTVLSFFVMNGFELSDGINASLMVDFDGLITEVDPDSGEVVAEYTYTMPGWESYVAVHEDSGSFTEQSYNAFGASVSVAILPIWGAQATLVDTTQSTALLQNATLDTEWDGMYQVQLSATDAAGQTGSAIMSIRVAADACEGAQLDTATWSDFSSFDLNEDCDVNLLDFAELSAQWLDDRNMTGQK